MFSMPQMRIRRAADLLGVSDDTFRRWIDAGERAATTDTGGHLVVEGRELARAAVERARPTDDPTGVARSARNRFVGLVTEVQVDGLMAQVELQCGPHRVVSLMSREAAEDLGLEPGVEAVAVVKATMVVVETSDEPG